jgi:hypothetical protein
MFTELAAHPLPHCVKVLTPDASAMDEQNSHRSSLDSPHISRRPAAVLLAVASQSKAVDEVNQCKQLKRSRWLPPGKSLLPLVGGPFRAERGGRPPTPELYAPHRAGSPCRRPAAKYYSRGFPVCGRAAAQRDGLFVSCGYIASPPFGCGWLSGCGEEPGAVVVPAGDGLVASASL